MAGKVTRTQIAQILGHGGLRRLLAAQTGGRVGSVHVDNGDEDDEDEDIDNAFSWGGMGRRRNRRNRPKPELPPVPNPEGQKLMDSGIFGSNEYYRDILRKRNKRLSRRVLSRELGGDPAQMKRDNQLMSQGLIPSSTADTIIHYNSRCYSGQFSEDGNFFFSCAQDFKVRMYDTSNPYDWKYYKTVDYPYGQWTITDASLSPDNKFLAYSSIRSTVCLANTDPGQDTEPYLMDFADMSGTSSRHARGGYTRFGIWSIRFSGDGREIVAGTSDNSVCVYDIDAQRSILQIPGHTEHVNAVCFGDQSSPHVLYSGSDDSLIKVWDRRSMSDSREAGVFMGHTEGLTYVDSKGDGRYVLSNGKDQSMKLWDLRKMMSTTESANVNPSDFTSGFDYRFMNLTDDDYVAHPHDSSVVTFRGHSVLKTLIRCHFSPPGSTNSRYVYSGSEDGSIWIYNLDATVAGKINVYQATKNTRPRDLNLYNASYGDEGGARGEWKTCVRDASWHPNAPVVAATSWNGYGNSTGTCSVHSWNDGAEDDEAEPKMGRRVDAKLQHDPRLYRTNPVTRLRSRRVERDNAALEIDDDVGADW
jgi:WD repeat-containing protein 23